MIPLLPFCCMVIVCRTSYVVACRVARSGMLYYLTMLMKDTRVIRKLLWNKHIIAGDVV